MIAECVINRLHVVKNRGRCREERTRRGFQGKTGGEWIKGPTWRLRSSECALVLFGELEAGTAASKDFARSHNPSKKTL